MQNNDDMLIRVTFLIYFVDFVIICSFFSLWNERCIWEGLLSQKRKTLHNLRLNPLDSKHAVDDGIISMFSLWQHFDFGFIETSCGLTALKRKSASLSRIQILSEQIFFFFFMSYVLSSRIAFVSFIQRYLNAKQTVTSAITLNRLFFHWFMSCEL